jgi:hypothetical protein
MPDEYIREEIRDAVWQATLGVPATRSLGVGAATQRQAFT